VKLVHKQRSWERKQGLLFLFFHVRFHNLNDWENLWLWGGMRFVGAMECGWEWWHMASGTTQTEAKKGHMASGHTKTEAKTWANFLKMYKYEHIWLRLDLTTEAEEGLYGFGLQPRPNATLFWPRPNMPRSGNRCKIWKITAAKRPSCTSAVCSCYVVVIFLWTL